MRSCELPPDKPKVLVVDDERVIADTLAIILNQHGFEASAAYNGIEAVEQAHGLRPDLIICDVIMPQMDGIEAAILIREFLPSCKILLFSGQAATADLLESARARGHEFEILAKPVHPQDLLAKIRQALGENSESTIRKLNLESAVKVLAELEVLKKRIESAAVKPFAEVEVAKERIEIEAEAQAPAKAVTLPARARERKNPLFTPQSLVGAIIWYLIQYLVKFAGFILILMAVFAVLACIGYGLDQLIARAPHIQRQHYAEPVPAPHDDIRFRLLKT